MKWSSNLRLVVALLGFAMTVAAQGPIGEANHDTTASFRAVGLTSAGTPATEASAGAVSLDESEGHDPAASTLAVENAVDADLLTPRTALWRSAALPGWGQWSTGHRLKAILFAGIAASWASAAVIEHGRIANAPTPQAHQDRVGTRNTRILWYVISATAAGLDAFVDAHLDDFDVGGIETRSVLHFGILSTPRPTARLSIAF